MPRGVRYRLLAAPVNRTSHGSTKSQRPSQVSITSASGMSSIAWSSSARRGKSSSSPTNIWFTMELLARFDRNRKACTYYDVSEDGMERGVVSVGQSPRLDTWSDKRKRINITIERAKDEGDRTMRDVLVEKGYDDLRGACELVVERDLLQNVVQSYRPNVMVGNLTKIRFDRLAAASATVNEVFDKCCRINGAHKQPLETLSVRPTLTQLEEDWKTIHEVHAQFSS